MFSGKLTAASRGGGKGGEKEEGEGEERVNVAVTGFWLYRWINNKDRRQIGFVLGHNWGHNWAAFGLQLLC